MEMRKDDGLGSYAYLNRDNLPGGQPSFYENAPDTGKSFQYARDPLIAAQHADMNKSEHQRRFEAMCRGPQNLSMVEREQPRPEHRPPPPLAMGADRAAFQRRWSQEQERAWKARRRKADSSTSDPAQTHQIQTSSSQLNFLDAQYRSIFIAGRKAQMKSKGKARSR
ncbi:MAG: hypothetical protein KDI65_10605 [Alphaproteobacteria bacterium]|nr:hypothetical protein [Alphaproteobacteria bacterium]